MNGRAKEQELWRTELTMQAVFDKLREAFRGFNRSGQPVNFAAHFPNHYRLLFTLNFI